MPQNKGEQKQPAVFTCHCPSAWLVDKSYLLLHGSFGEFSVFQATPAAEQVSSGFSFTVAGRTGQFYDSMVP